MSIKDQLRRWRHEHAATKAARALYGPPPGRWVAEAHELRVEAALARARSLAAIGWTPDVTPRSQLEAFFASFSIRDVGVPLIRVGGDGDGGYLIPDDLADIVACYSPGVADQASFEAAMIERGIPCHLLDASVSRPPIEDPLITFSPLFLGGAVRQGWTTLDAWVGETAPATGDLILQMDIEGWEWEALARASTDTLERFRVLIVELHDLHLVATSAGLRRVSEVFRRLSEHFVLVHVHPNNYEFPIEYLGFRLHPVVEATWLRRDRIQDDRPVAGLTHPHEQANAPELPDLPLDPRWA